MRAPQHPTSDARDPTSGERATRPGVRLTLLRGLRGRCPKCGEGGLFRRWHWLHEKCSECGCEFKKREGDCWGFMYFTMAACIGLVIVFMLLFPAQQKTLGYVAMIIALPVLLVVTLPYRKGLAVAIDCLVDPDLEQSRPGPGGRGGEGQ